MGNRKKRRKRENKTRKQKTKKTKRTKKETQVTISLWMGGPGCPSPVQTPPTPYYYPNPKTHLIIMALRTGGLVDHQRNGQMDRWTDGMMDRPNLL